MFNIFRFVIEFQFFKDYFIVLFVWSSYFGYGFVKFDILLLQRKRRLKRI